MRGRKKQDMSSRLPTDERAAKVVEFLKAMGINSDKRIEDIAKECQVSRAAAYNWINYFVRDFVLTDQDPDFPRRLTTIYNQDLPAGSDKLDGEDVERLRHFVDEFYAKNIPPPTDNINMQENPSRTMSYNNVDPTRDTTTEEGYLRSLLMNAKYVNPTQIERFIQQYSMNKEVFDKNPLELLDHMKYMFGPQAGQNIFNLWQKGRGKFVYGSDQQQQGIDPMMFAMLMGGGGGVNPAMMQSMMGGGGNPNMLMNAMMISQMNQQSQREAARRDQQEQMERMMQMMMMRFATQAVDDRKPWMDQGMGMGMSPMGYQIQEYPDESGRIKYRSYVPNFPGQQMGQHQDPMMTMIMGKQMDLTNALVAKMADTGKQPTDLLLGLIPHFKQQGDMGAQMSQMIDTINKVAPGFFSREQNRGGGLEEAKLKFDTDLAKMAQQIELAKMQHNWRVDEMDRTAANDNAKSWMSTFTQLGDRIVTDIAPAVLKGFGGGMLNKDQQGPPQMNPQLQQQLMMQQQQRAQMARQQQMEAQAQQQQQQQPQQQMEPGMVYMITALQNQLQQSENHNKILMQKMQEIESQSQNARQQQFSIDEKRLGKMTTGQLQTLLQELQLQNNAESRLKSVIESEIHNRQVIGSESVIESQADLPDESSNEDINKQFNSGEEPMSNAEVSGDSEKLEGT